MDKRCRNPQETPMPTPLQTEMETLLTAAFAPIRLEVINDSAKHHGHTGDDGSGESHFTVVIESAEFAGKSRLERQRMVNRALGDLMAGRVHAMAIGLGEQGQGLARLRFAPAQSAGGLDPLDRRGGRGQADQAIGKLPLLIQRAAQIDADGLLPVEGRAGLCHRGNFRH